MNRLKKSYSTCMSCGGKKMKSGGNWIKSAIKKPGSFTAQAKNAGMSVPAFRDKVLSNKEKFSSTTVKRANLAKTLSGMRKGEDGMEMDMPKVKAIDPLNLAAKTTLNKLEGSNLSPERQKVMKYQQMLQSKGFDIAADGAWGPQTQKAYESYINKSKSKVNTPANTYSNMGPSRANMPGTKQSLNFTPAGSKVPMSTSKDLKMTPMNAVSRVVEPASVTAAFNNLAKYKKTNVKKAATKMNANEALVMDRLAKYKAGKPLR
jgi:hypothetical protein